jgi:Ca2+:H+ antiporter
MKYISILLMFVPMGNPLTLIFNQLELLALGAAVGIAALISLDGESNWLEAAQLLAVYVIVALAVFFLPTQERNKLRYLALSLVGTALAA